MAGEVRKRRVRRQASERSGAWSRFEPAQQSVLTVEGQIEQYGRMASGVNRARGWRRTVGKGFLIMWLVGLIAGPIAGLVMVIVHVTLD